MGFVGYEKLRQQFGLAAFDIERPAKIMSVTRIEQTPQGIWVPRSTAPTTDDPLDHLLFALKHEGINLPIIVQAVSRILPERLLEEIRATPNGANIRKACYLWETHTGNSLDDIPPIGGQVADLFDAARYVTASGVRNAKWRVRFNGLGSPTYCPTVERTPVIDALMNAGILEQANSFIGSLSHEMMDRALAWAYLSEIESSFAIERETPSESKAESFANLLRQAHDPQSLSESYLAELQSSAVSSVFDQASSFRGEQNWLRGPLRGAAGVTYVPPAPGQVADLMRGLMSFANGIAKDVDPLVAASVISFGFVFIHPFMDGNGRLSRFLFHHALCQSGRLEKGFMLPVSIAMKRNEADYLAALKGFSKKARRYWDVTWLDGDEFDFKFTGHPSIYQFWNATQCVEFGFKMAQQALEVDLRKETEFLSHYDQIVRAVNDAVDIRNSDLATLVVSCLQHNGTISKNRRKQYGVRVPETTFALIERITREKLNQSEYVPGFAAT
jgi:hypothetical protein